MYETILKIQTTPCTILVFGGISWPLSYKNRTNLFRNNIFYGYGQLWYDYCLHTWKSKFFLDNWGGSGICEWIRKPFHVGWDYIEYLQGPTLINKSPLSVQGWGRGTRTCVWLHHLFGWLKCIREYSVGGTNRGDKSWLNMQVPGFSGCITK